MALKYLEPASGTVLSSDVAAGSHRPVVVLGNQAAGGAGLMPGDTTNGLFVNVRNYENGNAFGSPVKNLPLNFSTNGQNDVIAAVSGKKIRILALHLWAASAVNLTVKSGSSTTRFGPIPLSTSGTYIEAGPNGWVAETATNIALNLFLSSGVAVTGFISYVEVV